MFSETFEDADGKQRTVVAQSQEELDAAVRALKSLQPPTYPNINAPVAKGHDLTEVADDLSVKLVDGTGAHNSPENAVKDDGSLNGDPEVVAPGTDEAPEKVVDSGAPAGEPLTGKTAKG